MWQWLIELDLRDGDAEGRPLGTLVIPLHAGDRLRKRQVSIQDLVAQVLGPLREL